MLTAFTPLTLAKGDTLDFVVGYGNGTYFNDSTGLSAQVTSLGSPAAVPEASTTVSLGLLSLLGLGALTLARRRQAV